MEISVPTDPLIKIFLHSEQTSREIPYTKECADKLRAILLGEKPIEEFIEITSREGRLQIINTRLIRLIEFPLHTFEDE